VNVLPTPAWRASLFATVTRFQVPLTGESRSGGELALRLAAAF
jgi:hypothetical protein